MRIISDNFYYNRVYIVDYMEFYNGLNNLEYKITSLDTW